ncbi:MAG: GNAT family N-acetyltransferase [Cyanophyceae cyanobacterium]
MSTLTRPLTLADREPAIQLLMAAFAEDPVLTYLATGSDHPAILRCVFDAILTYCQPHNQLWGAFTADHQKLMGVAAWIPPEADANDELIWLSAGLYRLPLLVAPHRWGRWLPLFGGFGNRIPKPCWSLQLLGVSPDCQRQGVGSLLLKPALTTSRETGIQCHLETSTESAVQFYQQQGFRVVHERLLLKDDVRGNGVRYWTMLRDYV